MVNRIATGIDGLDQLIEGGLPEQSVTLVSGGPGCGKTIFCSQFLWHGLQNGENCLFITMEESADEILEDAEEFGWDFDEQDSFTIKYLNPFRTQSGIDDKIRELIEQTNADRVVIDSTSVMGMYANGPGDVRRQLYELTKELRRSGVTALMTAEIARNEDDALSRYGVEEFVADAVIALYYMGIGGGIYRNIEIPKIRKTDQEKGSFPMKISDSGIAVYEDEEAYADSFE